MIIILQQIKQVFRIMLVTNHEITLINYLFSNEKSIIRARVIYLNSMSLNFMLNEFYKNLLTMNDSIIIQKNFRNTTAHYDESKDIFMCQGFVSKSSFDLY
jgi:hypothetical protein